MKKYTAIIIVFGSLFVVLIAVRNNDKPTPKNNPNDMGKFLRPELDTFYLGDQLVRVEEITAKKFGKSNNNRGFHVQEENSLLKDSSVVKRRGDSLLITTSQKMVSFVDKEGDEDGIDAEEYYYAGYNADIGQYIVQGLYYEGGNYILIDSTTGDLTHIRGKLSVSPDKKYFIVYNSDIEAQYTPNGLELYRNADKPELVAERELSQWGPEEVKWSGNSTLLVKAYIIDSTQSFKYFKLILE